MRMFIVIMSVLFVGLTMAAFADERYDIIVPHQVQSESVFAGTPAYSTSEGRNLARSFRKVSVRDIRLVGVEFWNGKTNEQEAVLCRFKEGAYVLVDANNTPLYLVGCKGGTYFNRISVILPKPVQLPTPTPVVIQQPAPQVIVQQVPPQVVYVQQPAPPRVVYIQQTPRTVYCPPPPRRYCDSSDYLFGLNFRVNIGNSGGGYGGGYHPAPAYHHGGAQPFRTYPGYYRDLHRR